jgi:hypothetical protein
MNRLEVAQVLQNFIESRGKDWDWDDYTSGVVFEDPYLQGIQTRMSGLPDEFPPETKGHYCGPEGFQVIRSYINELRTRAIERSPQ